MGDMQIVVDGVSLDNGTWRRIEDFYGIAQGADGGKYFTATFELKGDTAQSLQERYQATFADFGAKNIVPFTLTLDTAAAGAGQYLESIAPHTLPYGRTFSRMSVDESRPQTDRSMFCRLELFAEVLGTDESTDIEGLVDEPKLGIAYNAGRVPVRSLLVKFQASGGNDAEANYQAARGSLLTNWLKTGSGGARGTTGMALTSEEIEQNDDADPTSMSILLVAEYMPKSLPSVTSARALTINISRREPERWARGGGTKPVMLDVVATASIDKDVYTGELLALAKASFKANVMAAVRQAAGEGGIREAVPTRIGVNLKQSVLELTATFQAKNARVLSYDVTTREPRTPKYRVVDKADGFQVYQRSPAPDTKFVEVVVTRLGRGRVNLYPPTPIEAGYIFVPAGDTPQYSAPLDMPFGTNMFEQSIVARFERVRVGTGPVGDRRGSVAPSAQLRQGAQIDFGGAA